MKIETLDKMLEHDAITNIVELEEYKNDIFKRVRTFTVRGHEYRIIWYHNMSTLLIHDDLSVMFTDVEQSNTWPHRSKMNLQFRYDGEVVCVLRIESYSNKEADTDAE